MLHTNDIPTRRRVAPAARLSELGLQEDDLRRALHFGVMRAASCTAHDPPSMAGIMLWGGAVRGLRDVLTRRGWRVRNDRNYATVVAPDGALAIAVASGDECTGRDDRTPRTRSAKGPVTKEAVLGNQLSFADLHPSFVIASPTPRTTWLLLHYHDRDTDELRAELSLPAGFDADDLVVSWHERIVLGPLPLGYTPPPIDVSSPPVEIEITRR